MQYRLIHAVTIAATLLLIGCDGKTLGSISADEELPATRVEGAGLTGILPTTFSPFNLDVESSQAFRSADYDIINEIKITGITLRILPESQNAETDRSENGIADDFSFINTLSLYIQADINGASERELLAELPDRWNEMSKGLQEFSMVMQNLDILQYVEAEGGYRIESEASGNPPDDDVVFGGTVGYRAKIGFR